MGGPFYFWEEIRRSSFTSFVEGNEPVVLVDLSVSDHVVDNCDDLIFTESRMLDHFCDQATLWYSPGLILVKCNPLLQSGLLREAPDDASEDFWVIHCQICEGFAVECDFGLLESADESRIRHAEFSCCGVDAKCPQIAVFALFSAAMSECVGSSVANSFVGDAFLSRAVKAVALRLRKNVLAALYFHCSSFDA